MLWSIYQPLIQEKVLYPYLTYLMSFIFLQPYIDHNFSTSINTESDFEIVTDIVTGNAGKSQIVFITNIGTVITFYLYFISFEVVQFKDNPHGYLLDPSNVFDVIQYLLNSFILGMFLLDYIRGDDIMHTPF